MGRGRKRVLRLAPKHLAISCLTYVACYAKASTGTAGSKQRDSNSASSRDPVPDLYAGPFTADKGYRDPYYAGAGLGAAYGGYGSYGVRDFAAERDYVGTTASGYGGLGTYGHNGAYGNYGDIYGRGLSDLGTGRGPGGGRTAEDDCGRVEANGVVLADVLREAVSHLGDNGLAAASQEVQELVFFFVADGPRKLLLGNCPQAVVLARLLQLERETDASEQGWTAAAQSVSDLLALAPALQAPFRPAPVWTGPWEPPLSSVQRRTGLVLFPMGEQQFYVQYVSPQVWSIHPRRRCVGRRDLGNLQATPLSTCLSKCSSHPLCTAATYWHWQPGGFGFEQRCFLSSTCTSQLATAEGAENAVLFEKRDGHTSANQAHMHRLGLTRGGAPWAPRCGHQLVSVKLGHPSGKRAFLLLGGVGVDPFTNTSAGRAPNAMSTSINAKDVGISRVGSHREARTDHASTAKMGFKDTSRKSERTSRESRGEQQAAESNITSNVIEAYLSRHVELSGELPPLRSLQYGRLGDLWSTTDRGRSWALMSESSPWGPRAFFGAIAASDGSSLLVFGGTLELEEMQGRDEQWHARRYMNDVWFADLSAESFTKASDAFVQLPAAPWEPRAAFQAFSHYPAKDAMYLEEDGPQTGPLGQFWLLGGRLGSGRLLSDVWSATIHQSARASAGSPQLPRVDWELVEVSAPWTARADFAAASDGIHLWVLGGCDSLGHALADVWASADGGRSWQEIEQAAPWGPRIGAVAASLRTPAGSVLLLYGGYAYPDAGFEPLHEVENNITKALDVAAWVSRRGDDWHPLTIPNITWMPYTKHAALLLGDCEGDSVNNTSSLQVCAYITGGLTHEGYYDNTAHRLEVPTVTWERFASPSAVYPAHGSDVDTKSYIGSGPWEYPPTWPCLMAAGILMCMLYLGMGGLGGFLAWGLNGNARKEIFEEPLVKRLIAILGALCISMVIFGSATAAVLVQLSSEVQQLRDEPFACSISDGLVEGMRDALGLSDAGARWDQIETLLRLAFREPQFGTYGIHGYAADYYGDSLGRSGGKNGGYKGSYSSRYGDFYGAYGSGSGYGDDPGGWSNNGDVGGEAAATHDLERELSVLPTTQSLSCRSPRCDRNATTCRNSARPRSWSTPYGCCSDYMMLMLVDVTGWLDQQKIPYFITYGTLLGALRENDILPYTQDMDIVVDRAHWPRLQQGLEAADFYGSRKYMFGVDQWEERVSRVCADWEGFAASIIGGPDGDRFSRAADFHLDIYASDWWQIKDMHLIDCVEPLGSTTVSIRDLNFSAPARPRACLEKLYGAEWRTPKRALSGVN